MNRLNDVLDERRTSRLRRWCIMKQVSGFMGRPNKEPDTCYSFWVGATLALLDSFHTISTQENLEFVKTTEDTSIGGFAKYPNVMPGTKKDLFNHSILLSTQGFPFILFDCFILVTHRITFMHSTLLSFFVSSLLPF